MMAQFDLSLTLSSPDATARLGQVLAAQLVAGDVVLLDGPVGAGKTHFARALITSVLAVPEDVPSPTFTLVQTYETERGEIWHADLYRLTSTQEIEELGLTEAFDTAICLVEWPDRLGALRPASALSITLENGEEADVRLLKASWQDAKWQSKLDGWRV